MSAEIKPPDKIMTQVAEAANHGRFIWLARFGWLIIFVLMMSLFAVNLPHVYLDTANEWQVGQALFAALQIFPSIKEFAIAVIGLRLVALTVFVGTALFLAWRKWDDWFVLFVSATLLMIAYMFGMNFDVDLIRYPRWLEQIFPAIRSVVPVLLVMNMLLLFYLFPDGRFVPRWLGLLLLPALVVLADVFGVTFEAPWDDFIGRILGNDVNWWTLCTSLLLATALVGLISQFVRYRYASSQEQRQQTKWVLLGLASIIATPFLLWVILDQLALGTQSTRHFISIIIETIIPILLPVTIAISIMRFKLWEVDLLINRALVYGGLTALILAVYGLGVGLVGVLLPTATSWFVPALALALVILVVSPLRDRIQTWANRILPVQHSEEPENRVLAPAVVSWPMRLAQAVWLVVLAFVSWQIVSRLISFDQTTQRMLREWIVQESTRGLASRTTENFVRLIVVSEIWTLVISVATAVVIFWRKRYEWMALYAAYMLLIASFAVRLASYPTPLEEVMTFSGMGLLLFFPFIFPDGRLVPRSWQWRGLLMATLFLTPLLAFAFARLARPDVNADENAYLSFVFTLTAVLVAGVINQIYRYRRLSNTVQRRQTRWVVLGFSARVAWFV